MQVAHWVMVVTLTLGALGVPELPPALTDDDMPRRISDPVLVGAGDIAGCDAEGDEATAELLDEIDGAVFTLEDNVYLDGSEEEFEECYDLTWGRHKERTRPTPGNHDYVTPGAEPYFDYFGEAAGDPETDYYSYDLGEWHIIVLNSNCEEIGGCDENSEQVEWLLDDLDENPAECTLAYWHHPRFSSGDHGDSLDVAVFWEVLAEAGAEFVMSGDDHIYERYAPQDADGELDDEGMRQFIVGTGGYELTEIVDPDEHSEVRQEGTHGLLKLTLHDDSYSWEFISVDDSFTDTGAEECH